MRDLLSDESGLTTVEYALLLMLIAASGILAWQLIGGTTANMTESSTTEWPRE